MQEELENKRRESEETDWAWLAGLIEGEGWLNVYTHKHQGRKSMEKHSEIGIEMCDSDIIHRVQRLFGGNIHINAKAGDKGSLGIYKKDLWYWRVSYRLAYKVAKGIQPYIFGDKQQLIADIIDFCELGVGY